MSVTFAIIEDDTREMRVTVAGYPDAWGSAYPTTDPDTLVVWLDSDAPNGARLLTDGGDGAFVPTFMLVDRSVSA